MIYQSFKRKEYKLRRKEQDKAFNLPLLPASTIGSFPQHDELRKIRKEYHMSLYSGGDKSAEEIYYNYIQEDIRKVIGLQERLGLDVLVHGEAERDDMVTFFARKLKGFATTGSGFVRSYGNRFYKPPIIHNKISRPSKMTVDLTSFAKSLTAKPVKGIITGPMTIKNWSFSILENPYYGTEDILKQFEDSVYQIADAMRAEITDLESAGLNPIQIDEPALFEKLGYFMELSDDPLSAREKYLSLCINAFNLATSTVKPRTKVLMHMCYGSIKDIYPKILESNADGYLLELKNSSFEILPLFKEHQLGREIGYGVLDVHNPATESVDDIIRDINTAIENFPIHDIWINPDCGLKTRTIEEAESKLGNMMIAVKEARKSLAKRLS